MKFSNIFLFVFILLFFSCKTELNKVGNVTKTYSYLEDIKAHKIAKIHLDSIDLNFNQITRLVWKKYYEDSIPMILFNDSDANKQVIPLDGLPHYHETRNLLRIKEDSMLWQFKNPISKLPEALKIHFENNGKDLYFSENQNKAIIEITIDTASTSNQLKKTLSLLTKEFDLLNKKHNDSLMLKLYFSILRQYPPPPPPKNTTSAINIKTNR